MIFKDPDDFRTMDPWRVFRIMAEFVDGFEEMARISPGVAIFGSARTKPDHPYYLLAQETARILSDQGYNIITGGGPGIMEAANRGGKEGKNGLSIGLNIDLPFEQEPNPYVGKLMSFRYFFCRKVMFSKYSCAIIIMPGGFGTLDEMFEIITLIQTNKIPAMPIVFMGQEYWQGLLDWVHNTMLGHGYISEEDQKIYSLTDDPHEAARIIIKACGKPQDTVGPHMPKKMWHHKKGDTTII